MNNKLINELFLKIYEELYSKAVFIDGNTYSWSCVQENAVYVPDSNLKHVPFDLFYLDSVDFEEIVDRNLKGKWHHTKNLIRPGVYLGPSPTQSREHFDEASKKFEEYSKMVPDEICSTKEISDIIGRSESDNITVAIAWNNKRKKSIK